MAVAVAYLWPDTYVSTAVLRVVPPQVPEAYVPTNVNLEMSQRINSMAQTILSRGTLTNIVNTYGLYPRERARRPLEDIVEQMRLKDVRVSSVVSVTQTTERRSVPAFQISYAYENRAMAQKVCADLVSRFINENTRDRANQSVFTTQFLKDQLESARKDLENYEKRLADFRTRNIGRLPDQMQSNLQTLNAMEARMSNLNGSLSRINQEKLLLESQMRIAKDQLNALEQQGETVVTSDGVPVVARNERLIQFEKDIQNLELQLAAMRETYRENHPDVQRMMKALHVLKQNRDALLKQEETKKAEAPKAAPTPAPARVYSAATVREARDLEAAVRRYQSQIEAKDLELEETQKEVGRVAAAIKNLQQRIEVTPLGEKEYLETMRERDMARDRYLELSRKRSISAMSTDLENRQQGETLELLDPASLPMTPTEPKREIIVAIGSAMGLFLGLVLAGMREMKDTSLKNLKDVRAYTQLTVLGSIPLLENDLVVRRRRRLAWLGWSTACIAGVLVMSGAMYYYYFVVKV
jgi:uncharacterized protein involved in exopolysaccharide biosynthesis